LTIIHSRGTETRDDIRLFPEILLTLFRAYPDEPDRQIIESLENKLKGF
jgi:hypothetical protein